MTATVTALEVAERFLAALRARDYDGLATCFAPDATMRSVVPPGVREDDGVEAIVARFRRCTAAVDDYAVEAEAEAFADLVRLRWLVQGRDPSADFSPSTFEQTAYAQVDGGRISRVRLACSGHRPLA